MRNIVQDAMEILNLVASRHIADDTPILPKHTEVKSTTMDTRKIDEGWLARSRWQLFEVSKEYKVARAVFVAFLSKSTMASVICEAEDFRHRIPGAQVFFHRRKQLWPLGLQKNRLEHLQERKDTCANINVQHTDLIHQEELQRDQLCNLLIGGLAEIELGFVLAIETERVMQRARGDNRPWLFNVGSCYKHYLPRKRLPPPPRITYAQEGNRTIESDAW